MLQEGRIGSIPAVYRVVACWMGLFLIAGGIHRAAVNPSAEFTSPSRVPGLGRVPIHIGTWQGRDVPIDPRIQAVAQADESLNRRYVDSATRHVVDVYVAFTSRPLNMLGHRPDVCYPANGWHPVRSNIERIRLEDGSELECLTHQFSRGGEEGENLLVFNYYILPGAITTDWTLFASPDWRRAETNDGTGRFVAQVQFVGLALFPSQIPQVSNAVRRFAGQTVPMINALLDDYSLAPATPQDP